MDITGRRRHLDRVDRGNLVSCQATTSRREAATSTPLQKYRSTASPATRSAAIVPNGLMATDASIQTKQHEFRPMGTQTVALVLDGYVANPPPGGLSFGRFADEVPQIVHYLSTEQCNIPLQGPDLDRLLTLVTFAALYEVRFIEDFLRREEGAPLVPDTGGRRDYTSLGYLLAEQVRRPLPPEVRMDDSILDVRTITSTSEPEVISDDDDP